MKVINFDSFIELGEEILEVGFEDGTWQRMGYLWDLWLFMTQRRLINVDYNNFITLNSWKHLVSNEEFTTFVESSKDNNTTII